VELSFPPRHRFCIDVRSQIQDTWKVCGPTYTTNSKVLWTYALRSRAICPKSLWMSSTRTNPYGCSYL